jgi:AcrR family transcriptional regulator
MSPDSPSAAARRRIREAAFDLAVDRGWSAATREAVIERAEVEPATFERHFGDIEECLLDVYDEGAEEMLSKITRAVAAEPTWLEQMRALGRAMVEFLLEDRRRARFIVVEVASGGDRVRVARERDLGRVCAMIDRGRFELEDPDSVGSDTAVAVAGAIFLRVYQQVASGQFDVAYEILPEMMHILVLPYLGEQAALAELHRPPPKPTGAHQDAGSG